MSFAWILIAKLSSSFSLCSQKKKSFEFVLDGFHLWHVYVYFIRKSIEWPFIQVKQKWSNHFFFYKQNVKIRHQEFFFFFLKFTPPWIVSLISIYTLIEFYARISIDGNYRNHRLKNRILIPVLKKFFYGCFMEIVRIILKNVNNRLFQYMNRRIPLILKLLFSRAFLSNL